MGLESLWSLRLLFYFTYFPLRYFYSFFGIKNGIVWSGLVLWMVGLVQNFLNVKSKRRNKDGYGDGNRDGEHSEEH